MTVEYCERIKKNALKLTAHLKVYQVTFVAFESKMEKQMRSKSETVRESRDVRSCTLIIAHSEEDKWKQQFQCHENFNSNFNLQ